MKFYINRAKLRIIFFAQFTKIRGDFSEQILSYDLFYTALLYIVLNIITTEAMVPTRNTIMTNMIMTIIILMATSQQRSYLVKSSLLESNRWSRNKVTFIIMTTIAAKWQLHPLVATLAQAKIDCSSGKGSYQLNSLGEELILALVRHYRNPSNALLPRESWDRRHLFGYAGEDLSSRFGLWVR